MKVRTPDGEIHDVNETEAARLIHTSGAVPVKDEPKPEKRPAKKGGVETR